jgi:hypothetical protein
MATLQDHINNIYAALGADYNEMTPPSDGPPWARDPLGWHLTNITDLLASGGGGSGGGVSMHNLLTNRGLADQHPISAITSLQASLDALNAALAGKLDKTAQAADSAKLGGQLPNYYQKAVSITQAANSQIMLAPVTVGGEPTLKPISDFATSAQGTLADNAQPKITGVASSTALLVQPTITGGQPQTRALNTLMLAPTAQTANSQLLVAPSTQGVAPTLKPVSDFIQKILLTPAMVTAQGFTTLRALVEYYGFSQVGAKAGTISAFTDLPENFSALTSGTSCVIEMKAANDVGAVKEVTLRAATSVLAYEWIRMAGSNTSVWDTTWFQTKAPWETLPFTPAANYANSGITTKLNRATKEICIRFNSFNLYANRQIGEAIGQLTLPSGITIPNIEWAVVNLDISTTGRTPANLQLNPGGSIQIFEMLPNIQSGVNGLAATKMFGQVTFKLDV